MKRYRFLVILLFLFTNINAKTLDKKSVNVVLGYDKPPYIFGKTAKKGIEVDMIQECFALMGYKANITQNSRSYMQNILYKDNEIEAVGTISKMDDKLYYSDTFSTYENYVITRKKDNLKINSLEDLSKVKFVSWKNSYYDLGDHFYKLFNPTNGKYKSSYHDNTSQKDDIAMFFSRKVDAIIVDETIFKWFKLNFKNKEEYTFHNIFNKTTSYPMVFRDKKLKDKFNIALKTLKDTGRYEEIIQFYLTQNVEELLLFTKVLSEVSSQYLFTQNKKKLTMIISKFFTHPDIENISIQSDILNLYLNKKKSMTIKNNSLKNLNDSAISDNIYYTKYDEILKIGKVTVHYKKNYKTNRGKLIPSFSAFTNLSNEDTLYIQNIYKKYKLIDTNSIYLSNKERAYLSNKKDFTVCTQYNFSPLDNVLNDKLYGIAGDIYAIIEKKLHIDIKAIKSTSNKDLEEKVKKNQCDFVSMLFTHQNRFPNINTSEPLFINTSAIITTIDKTFSTNESYTKNKKFIVLTKPYKNLILKIYPNLNIIQESNNDKIKQLLLSKEAYGLIYPNFLSDYKVKEYGYQDFKISGFLTKESPLSNVSLGVNDTQPLLLSSINKVLKTIDKEQMNQILNKWELPTYTKETDYTLVWQILMVFLVITLIGITVTLMLKRINKKLHQLINTTIEAIAIFKNGELIEANDTLLELYGYKKLSQIQGREAFSFVDQADHQLLAKKMQNSQKPYEITMVKSNGEKFPALVKATQLDEHTRISSVIDLSELKSTQNKLAILNKTLEDKVEEQLEKNKHQELIMLHQSRLAQMGEMISMIAHQWRQPLNNLSIINQTIVLKYRRNNLTKEIIETFNDNSSQQIKQMSNTIDDFREFFKPRKNKKFFSVNEILNQTIHIVKPVLQSTNISLTLEKNEEIFINGYPNELGQVFLNILTNAKDALAENMENKNKNIVIKLIEKDGKKIIIICDNAGGIKSEIIDNIFDPYFSTKDEKNGTGLGLYMSKTIVEDHMNGKLSVSNEKFVIENTEHNIGACFKISFKDNENE